MGFGRLGSRLQSKNLKSVFYDDLRVEFLPSQAAELQLRSLTVKQTLTDHRTALYCAVSSRQFDLDLVADGTC